MNRYSISFVLALALTAACGGPAFTAADPPGATDPNDSGRTTVPTDDAGQPLDDAGRPPQEDSGTLDDAGRPVMPEAGLDTGSTDPEDAGSPTGQDSGSPDASGSEGTDAGADSGSVETDAGKDAGSEDHDAGADSGSEGHDAGNTNPSDAGSDSAAPSDDAGSEDAGPPFVCPSSCAITVPVPATTISCALGTVTICGDDAGSGCELVVDLGLATWNGSLSNVPVMIQSMPVSYSGSGNTYNFTTALGSGTTCSGGAPVGTSTASAPVTMTVSGDAGANPAPGCSSMSTSSPSVVFHSDPVTMCNNCSSTTEGLCTSVASNITSCVESYLETVIGTAVSNGINNQVCLP